MKSANVTELPLIVQHLFLPASGISDAMRKNTRCFWDNQDKIVDAMQTFANGWFERRHTGSRAAFEAAEHICKADTPVEVLSKYQDWASGAIQRVMTDGVTCQQQSMTVAGLLVRPFVGENERLSLQTEGTSTRSSAA
jgi:hypothetical protein